MSQPVLSLLLRTLPRERFSILRGFWLVAGAVHGAARERGGGDRSDVGAAPALVLRGRGEQVAGVAAELPAADATAAALTVRSPAGPVSHSRQVLRSARVAVSSGFSSACVLLL